MRSPRPGDATPPEYWDSILNDPRADVRPEPAGPSIRTLRLSEIHQQILRVCSRCGRAVEIQKADAVRLAGAQAVWKVVGQQLLDDTCRHRTEEDGGWPAFE